MWFRAASWTDRLSVFNRRVYRGSRSVGTPSPARWWSPCSWACAGAVRTSTGAAWRARLQTDQLIIRNRYKTNGTCPGGQNINDMQPVKRVGQHPRQPDHLFVVIERGALLGPHEYQPLLLELGLVQVLRNQNFLVNVVARRFLEKLRRLVTDPWKYVMVQTDYGGCLVIRARQRPQVLRSHFGCGSALLTGIWRGGVMIFRKFWQLSIGFV